MVAEGLEKGIVVDQEREGSVAESTLNANNYTQRQPTKMGVGLDCRAHRTPQDSFYPNFSHVVVAVDGGGFKDIGEEICSALKFERE